MKKNDIVEKKIIESLESAEQKPSSSVLDAAKSELRTRKARPQKTVYRYAFAICAAVLICLAVVLPLTLINKNDGMQELQYSSMYDYFKNNNIDINTYDHLFDKKWDPSSGSTTIEKSPYSPEECILVKYKEKDIFIKQKYIYAQTDIITVSVFLANDDDIKQTFFGDYSNLEKSTYFMKVTVRYRFDEESKMGKVALRYKDKDFYIDLACDSESVMITHIQALIISQ